MTEEKEKYTNHLIDESSPYLLQHAHNPVDWYPWGDEALEKAQKENKLILVSIGYAACHWCHVMESESFEDAVVAEYMNTHYVCIKVDREERPDIDQIYMSAVQLITGRGGWPLNCVALPDGRPLYGGTYFPKNRWLSFLQQIVDYVTQQPEKAEGQADHLTAGVRQSDQVVFNSEQDAFSTSQLKTIFDYWEPRLDFEKGGNQGAPKFPLPIGFEYLLHYHDLTGEKKALEAVVVTLDHMARGGIYDQIGGGFARYSTDPIWKVPHFEKMLYDNAQLVSLYSKAYQVTGNKLYEKVVHETLGFIAREMTDSSGGFYSALDADSEGVEGLFYVWDKSEMEEVLGEQAPMILEYYHVTEEGNWEGSNILLAQDDPEGFAEKYGLPLSELESKVHEVNKALLEARSARVRPGLDDKILTSWNAMMLRAYVVASRVFGREDYLETALKNARFIRDQVKREDGGLFRNYKNGKSTINGFLDDYAFVISGFIELYQATFDETWLDEADQLLTYALQHFFDSATGLFYYTSNMDPALVARKMELTDNVIPSSNSEMAKNLYILGQYLYRDEYVEKARQMLHNVLGDALRNGPYYANWDILLIWMVRPPYEVAVVGPGFKEILNQWNLHYLPNVFLSGGSSEGTLELLQNKYVAGSTMIYVCQDKVCLKPVTTIKEALQQMSD
ncbi:thioredoxin domain-containing protein [Membranicola marinus]|uniref:Thioredoxin domain-containing protein n=1 Tax=Membranihabitans marinus TaxID=1227546 RepID=A0A953HW22_9BACT|nr:thioredoxin domain-containing protein [Membranihabitans marinus]MBY5957586.1 thioredoxin domain-containing protein [Membranihabitans marinus]